MSIAEGNPGAGSAAVRSVADAGVSGARPSSGQIVAEVEGLPGSDEPSR